MQTKREYLASKGLAIAGARGKFSNDAKRELERARAEGMRFSDDNAPVRTRAVNSAQPTGEPRESSGIADIVYTYPENEYVAIETRNGKRVERSMREACQNCRVSLVGHNCDDPVIVSAIGKDSVHVIIERVK